MSERILLVTGLNLRDLASNVHGVFQRFRVLVGGAAMVSSRVEILMISAEVDHASPDPEAEEQIRRHWNLQVTVHAVKRTYPPFLPSWLAEQLLQASSYRRGMDFRGIDSAPAREVLARLLKDPPRAVIAHRLPMMELVERLVPRSIPVVFDIDDVEHIAFGRKIEAIVAPRDRFFARMTVPAIVRAERRAMRRASRTFVCSEHDRVVLEQALQSGGGQVVVLPNSCRIRELRPTPAEPILLFVGTFGWPPNMEAADFFIRQCWNAIRSKVPAARLLVVGREPERIPAHASKVEGVEYPGFVEDLDSVYRRARLVICPVLRGGGTRVKLVEAAAHGKPVVSTTLGAEGLGFEHRVHALLADSPEDFTAGCIEVLNSDELAAGLSARIHAHAERRFSEASARTLVSETLRRSH